jgi:hypothetical protein
MMTGVTVVCVLCALANCLLRPIYRELQSCRQIASRLGSVCYLDAAGKIRMAFPCDGEATFWQIVKARVNRWSCDIALPNYPERVSDAEMRLLADFARVVGVDASSQRMLETVTKSHSRITTKGLKVLWDLKQLETLYLPGVKLSCSDLERLGNMDGLRVLDLSDALLDHAGCRHLGRLRRLQRLSLSGSNVSDADCAHLARLTSLTHLDLLCTGVSASGMKELATLTNLTILNLEGTEVGDEAIPYIRRFDKLKCLGLCYCRITPEGEYALEAYLPRCDLVYLPLHRPKKSCDGSRQQR